MWKLGLKSDFQPLRDFRNINFGVSWLGVWVSSEDVPQIEIEEQLVEVPVTKHVQVPLVQKVQKMVEVPQVEYEDQVVDVPVQKQVHIPFQQAGGDGVKWDEFGQKYMTYDVFDAPRTANSLVI